MIAESTSNPNRILSPVDSLEQRIPLMCVRPGASPRGFATGGAGSQAGGAFCVAPCRANGLLGSNRCSRGNRNIVCSIITIFMSD